MRIPVQTRGYLQHSKRQPVPRSSHSALCHGLWWRAHWMPVGLAVHVMLCSEQTRQTCCLLCWEWKWNYSRLSATNVMVLNALPWQRVGVPGTRGYVHFSPPHNARIISCSQKILWGNFSGDGRKVSLTYHIWHCCSMWHTKHFLHLLLQVLDLPLRIKLLDILLCPGFMGTSSG